MGSEIYLGNNLFLDYRKLSMILSIFIPVSYSPSVFAVFLIYLISKSNAKWGICCFHLCQMRCPKMSFQIAIKIVYFQLCQNSTCSTVSVI